MFTEAAVIRKIWLWKCGNDSAMTYGLENKEEQSKGKAAHFILGMKQNSSLT